MQIQFWPFKAVPVCLLPTPHWGFRRLLPWRQSHTSICPRLPLVWPEISSESITHLRLAGHVSHGKSAVSHILRGIVVEYLCVCVCLPLQHRLLNRCVLEVLWDYTPVWCPDERLSEWPQDTCSKHNSHPPLWDGAGVNHHLSPLPCTTPGHPEIAPVHESGSLPTCSLRPTLCRWHPWQHERCMSAGWKNVTGNVEKRDWHGKTLERGFKASRQ